MAEAATSACRCQCDCWAEIPEPDRDGQALELYPGPDYELFDFKIWRNHSMLREADLRLKVERQLDLEPGQPYWFYEVLDPWQFVWTTEGPELANLFQRNRNQLRAAPEDSKWNNPNSDPLSDIWWMSFLQRYCGL